MCDDEFESASHALCCRSVQHNSSIIVGAIS